MMSSFYKNIAAATITMMVAVAIYSCQSSELESASEFNGVTLNFSSENAGATKTEWTGKTIVWSAGDAMSMVYSLDGVWNNEVYPSEALEAATAVANFSVPTDLQSDATGEFAFAAVYPSSAVAGTISDSKAMVIVPSSQSPIAATFDKAADIMLGHSVETYTSVPAESIPMLWDRKVAHSNITLTAVSLVSGETIENVVITADEETALTGEFEIDLSSGEMSAKKASNAVTVDVSSLSVDSEGKLSFWVSFAPAKVNSLKVVLNTSTTTYQRVLYNCNIDFLVNAKNDLQIDWSEASTPSSTEMQVAAEQSKYHMTASEDLNGKITEETSGMKVILMDSKFYAVDERVLSVSFEADNTIAYVTENGETASESNTVTMIWKSDDLLSSPKVGKSADPGEYGILCLPGSYEGIFTVTTNRYTYQFEKTVELTAGATTSVTLDFASPLVQPVRKVGILGDSVSTFEGELCNPEYNSWYPGNDPNVTKNPDIAVNSKERTWWWMLLNSHMANGVLDVNSSFSGSRVVSQTRTSNLTENKVQCGFVDRAYDFVDPDIILIHGGSNDSANSQALGEYDWEQAVDSSTKHWYFRNAYIQLIKRLQSKYEGVQIIIIIGDALTEDYASSIIEIAEHFGLPYVSFQGVDVAHCSGAHPTYPAFEMMAETIYESCKDYLP